MDDERIKNALDVAFRYGSFDGGHHKMWCIDQMVRALLGGGPLEDDMISIPTTPEYEVWLESYETLDADGEKEYVWDEGTPP